MLFDLDAILFIGFLVINLWLGLSSSRGITTLREYSIGNKNFSTATIAYTIMLHGLAGVFFTRLLVRYIVVAYIL
ncbi:Sodium:solute symporter family N-terminal domain protein [Candidatus Trichorickettsia mobilis]|uniref:Sodium:solute symporter family N-terminal domain protein n=1 Tax=Candidatus Trichorickettsia mobilis TaxID=1346319 RepID=A0ABZ0UWH6_9RICK|nr:hypothetical protein [Candidatus Trichorickettsia mobilis]WPY00967.1 Sodium:solute symporter family N-terminal domain protein [Candidatus Trichorickettsia mobilis]